MVLVVRFCSFTLKKWVEAKGKSADPFVQNPIKPALRVFILRLVSFVSLLEMGSSQDGKEKAGRIELDWDDPIACQLGDLLLDNLDLVFESAVKEISEYGYDEQVAVKAVTRRGLYVDDGGDPIERIIDDALARLKGTKDASNIMTDKFDDLQHMTGYTLLEMVGVLREVRPFLSDGKQCGGCCCVT